MCKLDKKLSARHICNRKPTDAEAQKTGHWSLDESPWKSMNYYDYCLSMADYDDIIFQMHIAVDDVRGDHAIADDFQRICPS
jgi:hypothetical protein